VAISPGKNVHYNAPGSTNQSIPISIVAEVQKILLGPLDQVS